MALVALAGIVIFAERGFDFRLPAEIRAMADVPEQRRNGAFINACSISATRRRLPIAASIRTAAPDPALGGFDRGRAYARATQGAANPRFRHRPVDVQFLHSGFECRYADVPNCHAINDKVLALAREIQPDIVLLHGTWEKYLDDVAETVAALKQQTSARVIVLGSVPCWKRGLPNEVLRYFMLYHRLIPQRSSDAVSSNWYDAVMRAKLVPAGAEYISAWDAMCNADGCVTRIGDTAGDISGQRSGAPDGKRIGVSDSRHHRRIAAALDPAVFDVENLA